MEMEQSKLLGIKMKERIDKNIQNGMQLIIFALTPALFNGMQLIIFALIPALILIFLS